MRIFKMFVLALSIAAAASVSAETVAELDDIRDGELLMAGFELTKGAEVDIEALGMRQQRSSSLAVYAWLLDHETRELVWSMRLGSTASSKRARSLRTAEKTKFLEAGRYELYMHAADQYYFTTVIDGFKDFFDILESFSDDDEDWDDYDNGRHVKDCFVRVSSDELTSSDIKSFKITGEFPGALVSYNALGDDEYITQGFTLDQAMNLRIYALVEHPRGSKSPVDGGWIINADTHERVWSMDRFNTERAGGGRKNRKFDDEIRLEKGNYILHYATDDSHSWDGFNINPPYDPVNWGITLLPGTDFDPSSFHLTDIDTDQGKPLIDLTQARDNEFLEKAFELSKSASVYVIAVGEYSSWRSRVRRLWMDRKCRVGRCRLGNDPSKY